MKIIFLILLFICVSCSRENIQEELVNSQERQNRLLDKRNINPLSRLGYEKYSYLGSGYDITLDYANDNSASNQILDIERLEIDYPSRVIIEYPFEQYYIEEYGENALEYSKKITRKIGIDNLSLFKSVFTNHFSSSISNFNVFDAKYIYGSYDLVIRKKRLRLNATVDILKKIFVG